MRNRFALAVVPFALAAPALAQPAITADLGILGTNQPIVFGTAGTAAGQTKWYRFTLAQPVTYSGLRFLDIRTADSSAGEDCEIGLYSGTGQRIAFDNDDDVSFDAQLTFGTGGAVPPLNGASVTNGRDGDLPSGVYYLAVTQWQGTFNFSNWSVTPGPVAGDPATVTVLMGTTTPIAPAALTDLDTLNPGQTRTRSDALGPSEVRWYKINLPAASDAAGAFLDIDTEGSLLAPQNNTRLRLYGVNGAIQSVVSQPDGDIPALNVLNDDDDGSGLLAQFTFGASSAPRPAVGDGLPYNGRDGALRAGTYYLAVSSEGTSPVNLIISGASNFNTTSTSNNSGTLQLRIASGTVQSTPPSGVGIGAPDWVIAGTTGVLRVTVTPGANPTSTGLNVSVNASSIGGPAGVLLRDDGVAPDTTAGDRVFNGNLGVPAGATPGPASLPFTVTDGQGRSGSGTIALTVFGPPPGCTADALTVSGTNRASEGPAGDPANGVLSLTPGAATPIASIRLNGRYVPTDFFAFEAGVQIVPPVGGAITFFPINDFDNAGRPRDVVNTVIALPCPIPASAGTWSVRFFELSNTSPGNDGVWTSVCASLEADVPDAGRWDADRCATDAGDLPAQAQVPAGSGPLTSLRGQLEAEGADLFAIDICDVSTFSASTLPGAAIDTQLFLFDSTGRGVITNDNIAPFTAQSTINNSGGWITAPGRYYLGISGYDRDPIDLNANTLFAPFGPREGIQVPEGAGMSNPVAGWATTFTPPSGLYTITLAGVCYPSGGGAGCNRADLTEVGGTLEAPGAPDGQLTVDDLVLFVNLFTEQTGCPGAAPCSRADVTGVGAGAEPPDGELTVDDLIEFVNAFSTGC